MKVLQSNQPFDSSKITLGNPTPVQGGSYFTKIKMGDDSLYAQMPKCLTKKGIIHTEKHKYCDLMYERSNEEQLIDWIESIETCCQELINKKKHVWFHTELTRDDINTMMSPICRIYKSGKNILIRVNIETSKHDGQAKCIAYNEDETLVEIKSLQAEQKIIPLVHIDGIKFTARSFEICIYLHQFMILNKEEDLEANRKCMISLDHQEEKVIQDMNVPLSSTVESNTVENKITFEDSKEFDDSTLPKEEVETVEEKDPSLGKNVKEQEGSLNTEGNTQTINNEAKCTLQEDNTTENDNENENENDNENEVCGGAENGDRSQDVAEIEEVCLDVSNNNDSIQLKKSSEVYYEIYKDAKKKARAMREAALKAYLEAEKIKMKFSLDDICDDESDFDDSEPEDSDASSIVDHTH